jgi:hypothetical protein
MLNSNHGGMSYNTGTLIPSGGKRPPPPMLTQRDPNLQAKQVFHQNEQYIDEKNSDNFSPFPGSLNNQRPMTIANPTYEQYIVKPPKENVTHGSIPDIEIICSEDRNYTTYPDPSNYIVKLKDVYKNVTSIALFNASIPNTSYLVDYRNNLIYFRETQCEQLVAEVPEGDYLPCTLVTNIEKALNDVGDSKYTVILDELKNKITICSDLSGGDHIFSLDFYGCSEPHDCRTRAVYPPRSIGRIIGFPRENFLYASGKAKFTTGSGIVIGNQKSSFLTDFQTGDKFYVQECKQIFTVTSVVSDDEINVTPVSPCNAKHARLALACHRAQNKFNLSSDAFIILNILELENVRANSTPIDRAFAIIPMVFPHNTKNFITNPTFGSNSYIKYFNPPLSRLDRLTIKFIDVDGNIVNFQGIENFMEFRITTLNNPGKYVPGSTYE